MVGDTKRRARGEAGRDNEVQADVRFEGESMASEAEAEVSASKDSGRSDNSGENGQQRSLMLAVQR